MNRLSLLRQAVALGAYIIVVVAAAVSLLYWTGLA